MRTKTIKKNKINVVTLGCSKNIYDSEILMGQLKANGKNVVHEDVNDEGNIAPPYPLVVSLVKQKKRV